LCSAQEEQRWAKYRLDAAHDRLARMGPFSLLSRRGRDHKSATLDDIERFQSDVRRAAGRMAGCEQNRDRLSDEVTQSDAWHAEHGWRHGRLASIEAELADLGHIDLRHLPLPERDHDQQRHPSRSRAVTSEAPAWWAGRLAEIAAPPLPGRDAGLGMDLGL
jgi:hypothetical protein